jgi:hypothetical protein
MKKTTMMLMVAGSLTMPALAADPPTTPPAQSKAPVAPATGSSAQSETTVGAAAAPSVQSKIKFQTVLPYLIHPKTARSDEIDRYGGISSQPWDKVAGQPAAPLFEDQREYVGQPNFSLLWMGNTPP